MLDFKFSRILKPERFFEFARRWNYLGAERRIIYDDLIGNDQNAREDFIRGKGRGDQVSEGAPRAYRSRDHRSIATKRIPPRQNRVRERIQRNKLINGRQHHTAALVARHRAVLDRRLRELASSTS